MKITIEVELDNAAFHDETYFNSAELSRLLGSVGTRLAGLPYGKLDKEGKYGSLTDYNGNTVGTWDIQPNPDRR